MESAGRTKPTSRGKLISLAVILVAVALGLYTLRESAVHPSSSDSSIDADVVHVAAAVGGRILKIPVSENARIKAGDLLFEIDPVPYQLAVEQAEAELQLAESQRSNAIIASEEAKKAVQNHDLAKRTADRLRPLAASGYVPQQQLDQAEVGERDTATTLVQAQEHAIAALHAAEAAVRARQAALAIARRNLDDTMVRATHDGLVVGLSVSTGEIVAPAQSIFTLINSDEWFAVANFRETDLYAITVGDCATVYSMLDRRVPIKGFVQGIGWGVADQDRVNLPRAVPYVERSLNWVRVAQRFPVRIRLENPPPALLHLGASAVVEITHGASCR